MQDKPRQPWNDRSINLRWHANYSHCGAQTEASNGEVKDKISTVSFEFRLHSNIETSLDLYN
jgi:hypothetical protein